MIQKYLLAFMSLVIICSCNDNSKQKELELKQKELDLKDRELKLKEDSTNNILRVDSAISAEKADASNIENLVGFFFTPHAATINIRFYRNKTFVLNDYNSTLEKEEQLKGTYDLAGNTLTLYYDDRPKQKFKFYKGEGSDDNYYIKNSGNYFVKGENGDVQ